MFWANIVKGIQISSLLLILIIIYYIINIGNKFVDDRKIIEVDNRKIIKIATFIFILVVFLVLIKKYSFLSELIYSIFMSIIFSYVLNPIVNYLEERNLSRFISVLLVYICIGIIIFLLFFVFGPKIAKEFKRMGTILPKYLDTIFKNLDDIYDKYIVNLDSFPRQLDGIREAFKGNIEGLENLIIKWIRKMTEKTISIFSKLFNMILIPILSFYFLNDKDYFKKKLYFMIPKPYRTHILAISKDINKVITQFIKGRLIVAIFIGIVTTISLIILKVDFAIIIGMFAGLFDIIPYFGPIIGIIPALFFALLKSPVKALWVLIIFTIIQQVESNIITPKIVGESVGIHPVTVIISLIIGGGLFGILGMILAVPTVGVVKVIYYYLIDNIKRA